jgi:hypothetical protein
MATARNKLTVAVGRKNSEVVVSISRDSCHKPHGFPFHHHQQGREVVGHKPFEGRLFLGKSYPGMVAAIVALISVMFVPLRDASLTDRLR